MSPTAVLVVKYRIDGCQGKGSLHVDFQYKMVYSLCYYILIPTLERSWVDHLWQPRVSWNFWCPRASMCHHLYVHKQTQNVNHLHLFITLYGCICIEFITSLLTMYTQCEILSKLYISSAYNCQHTKMIDFEIIHAHAYVPHVCM